MGERHGSSIKDDKTYETLRRSGASKEKAARIANAKADPHREDPSKKGGRAPAYEDWSKRDLLARAREIGIDGITRMAKAELIEALRHH
ncbi:MAG: Rho termination factor [Rhodospirillales bacterium]|nr:Rho termination factor [Rhodospirillales bacterium]